MFHPWKTPSSLPLACIWTLPLVPFLSSYPLRNQPKYILPTTLASFLALTIELQ